MRSEHRQQNRRAFRRSAKQIRAEGGGVYQLDVMPFIKAMFHERGCLVLRNLVESATSGKAPLCLLCDNQIGLDVPPAVIIAMTAHCDAPTRMMGNAVCCSCAKPWDTLKERVMAVYRADMIPDLRELPPERFSADGGAGMTQFSKGSRMNPSTSNL